VLDYRVWMATESGSYSVLVSEVSTNSYTTIATLVAGSNYKFMVQSRNIIGYSPNSTETIIRASAVPNVPSSVSTSLSG
jgi:hypothetical protein